MVNKYESSYSSPVSMTGLLGWGSVDIPKYSTTIYGYILCNSSQLTPADVAPYLGEGTGNPGKDTGSEPQGETGVAGDK